MHSSKLVGAAFALLQSSLARLEARSLGDSEQEIEGYLLGTLHASAQLSLAPIRYLGLILRQYT